MHIEPRWLWWLRHLAQVMEIEAFCEYFLFLVEVFDFVFQNGGWKYIAEMRGINSKHFDWLFIRI